MARHSDEHDGNSMSTVLSILPDQPMSIDSYEFYERHNSESPPLKVNQLSLYEIEFHKRHNDVEIKALVRSTVQKEIRLKNVPVLLIDTNGHPVARYIFDLRELGSLPPSSARPWTFVFPAESFVEGIWPSRQSKSMLNGRSRTGRRFDMGSWSLAFEKKAEPKREHKLDLTNSDGIKPSPTIKRKLERVIETSPPLGRDEVNVMGLSLKEHEDGGLVAILLLRNGTSRDLTFKRIPLEVMDASREVVAKGTFQLENLVVKANTSKPTRFVFPANSILKNDMDLSSWKIYHVN
ncbi:MAG TPA: SLAP domain-containing protein [Bacillota bacterium]|nr:SLAP domain-containing protein [Bacillota bacterium]